MRLDRLQIRGLRSLADVSIQFAPGLNVLTGANGAGKTSVLEAAFLLSHGRSFRGGARDALLKRGESGFSVFAEWHNRDGNAARLGLGRTGNRWEARLDGETVSMGQLVSACAVVCFEPGSHALIAGGAEERRRYLDWGVFHVEHAFLVAWRRYQRALKQRNTLLRTGAFPTDDIYGPWEAELARCSVVIDQYRRSYLDALRPQLSAQTDRLIPELGGLDLRYRPGWPEELDLLEALAHQRGRDISRGHTSLGAHRADWSISFERAPLREHLSRGQEKLTALACYMAQAQLLGERGGNWPLVCLDDLASELDDAHQQAVVGVLVQSGAQIIITGTDVSRALLDQPKRLFHVEQGEVTPLL